MSGKGNFKAVNNFGLDKEIADRMNAKYDKNLEADIQSWIEDELGMKFDKDFGEMLKNGVVLCELVNKIYPGKVKKINRAGGLFRFQENITNFIRVCREVGVNEASLFPTESLAQLKDLNQVLTCVNAFRNVVVGNVKPDVSQKTKKKSVSGGLFKSNKKKDAPIKKKKSKWVIKPGGSPGMSLLAKGSAGVMERTKVVDAREEIKRKNLDGAGDKGEVSAWGKGSADVMEATKYTDAREQIKRKQLDGAGTKGEVSALNQGSHGMERTEVVDPREKIKRGEL